MWLDPPISLVQNHHKEMVEGAIEDVLAHVAPMAGRQGRFQVAVGEAFAHMRNAQLHQAGMAIGAVTFIGDPPGAHIAFFKHMHAQAQLFGPRDGFGVNGARVTVKYNVRDLLFGDDIRESLRPVR